MRPHPFGWMCVDCTFWAARSDKARQRILDDGDSGSCRRNAPTPRPIWQLARLMEPTADISDWADVYGTDEDARAEWPVTWADAWCGEFKGLPKPLRPEDMVMWDDDEP
jgi:hypothetical protein